LARPGLLYCFGFANVVEFEDVRFFGPRPVFILHSSLADSLGPLVLTFFGGSSDSVVVVEGPAI